MCLWWVIDKLYKADNRLVQGLKKAIRNGRRERRLWPGLIHYRRESGYSDVLHKLWWRGRAWFQSRTLLLVNSCAIPKALPLFLLPSSSHGGAVRELPKINCSSNPVLMLSKMPTRLSSWPHHIQSNVLEARVSLRSGTHKYLKSRRLKSQATTVRHTQVKTRVWDQQDSESYGKPKRYPDWWHNLCPQNTHRHTQTYKYT